MARTEPDGLVVPKKFSWRQRRSRRGDSSRDGRSPSKAWRIDLQTLLRVVVSFVLLNAPYWWLGRTDFLTRAWFNVDLLIPVALAAHSLLLGAVSLAGMWILDMAVSQSMTWNFSSPFEFIRSIEFLPAINLGGFVTGSGAGRLALFAAFGTVALWVARGATRARGAVLFTVVVVAAVDIANGSSLVWLRAERPLAGNVAGSAVKMGVTAMLARPAQRVEPLTGDASLTTRFPVLEWAAAHPDRSILVFVVESMGLHKGTALRKALHDSLVDDRIAAAFDVEEYAVPFHGSTVAGELREMCGLEGSYRLLTAVDGLRCLPNRLKAMGWQTVGLHGFSHRMFMREQWWPLLGLQRTLFAEDLTRPGDARCGGAFVGVCDAEIVRRAVAESRWPHRFVYTLTLNSHLPLETLPLRAARATTCAEAGVEEDVCFLTSVLSTALTAIRDAVAEEAPRPLVLVVGDHAPPFALRAAREQYSPNEVVGYVLVPKH